MPNAHLTQSLLRRSTEVEPAVEPTRPATTISCGRPSRASRLLQRIRRRDACRGPAAFDAGARAASFWGVALLASDFPVVAVFLALAFGGVSSLGAARSTAFFFAAGLVGVACFAGAVFAAAFVGAAGLTAFVAAAPVGARSANEARMARSIGRGRPPVRRNGRWRR